MGKHVAYTMLGGIILAGVVWVSFQPWAWLMVSRAFLILGGLFVSWLTGFVVVQAIRGSRMKRP